MKCKRVLNILFSVLFLFVFSVQVMSQGVLVPIEKLKSWRGELKTSQDQLMIINLQLKTSQQSVTALTIKSENLMMKFSDMEKEYLILEEDYQSLQNSAELLTADWDLYMERSAIADREFRKLQEELKELIERYNHILKGQKIRNGILIGESILIVILSAFVLLK